MPILIYFHFTGNWTVVPLIICCNYPKSSLLYLCVNNLFSRSPAFRFQTPWLRSALSLDYLSHLNNFATLFSNPFHNKNVCWHPGISHYRSLTVCSIIRRITYKVILNSNLMGWWGQSVYLKLNSEWFSTVVFLINYLLYCQFCSRVQGSGVLRNILQGFKERLWFAEDSIQLILEYDVLHVHNLC